MPSAVDSDGLPIGVQFTATFGAEHLLLQAAAHFQQACPEFMPVRPTVHVTTL